jgi:hypothetical protein
MLNKIFPLALALLIVFGSAGCAKKKKVLKKGELTTVERAKLKQNAINAYGKIVKDYPESVHASEAQKRLDVLQSGAKK